MAVALAVGVAVVVDGGDGSGGRGGGCGGGVGGKGGDPQKCLDEAAGDLRHMGSAIFYKQCQEVNTIARQILLGAPNSIKEQSI